MEDNNDLDFLGTFIRFHRFIFRNSVPMLIFCVLGAGVGLFRWFSIDNVYKGDFVVLDGNCPKYLLQENLSSIEYGKSQSTESAFPEILGDIVQVEMDTNFHEAVKVQVLLTKDSFPPMAAEEAVADLLSKNKVISRLTTDGYTSFETRLNSMKSELAAAKQMQDKLIKGEGEANTMAGMNVFGRNILELNKEIAKLEQKLKRTGNFEVVRPMGEVVSLKNNIVKELIFGLISGFFIGFLITAYVSLLKKARS